MAGPVWWHAGSERLDVRWSGSQSAAAGAARILDSLGRLAGSSTAATEALTLDVIEVGTLSGLVSAGATHPIKGPLAGLPFMSSIDLLTDEDLVYLRWRDAGILQALVHDGRARLYVTQDSRDKVWMIGTLTGTALHLSGSVRGVHAAAARWGGRTMLIGGDSGSGKSTLSLLLTCFGGSLLAEDFCYLDRAGRVAPVSLRDFVTLRLGTWHWLGDLLAERVPDGFAPPAGAAGSSVDAYHHGREGQVRLPLDLVANRADVGLGPVAVDTILLPRLSPETSEVGLSRITVADADARLFSTTEQKMFTWMNEILRQPIGTNSVRVPPDIECYIMDFGVRTDPTALRDALAQLFEGDHGRTGTQ